MPIHPIFEGGVGAVDGAGLELPYPNASLKLIKYHNHGHAKAGRDQNVLNGARMDCACNEGAEHLGHLDTLILKI